MEKTSKNASKVELLAPAGSLASLKAAVVSGADAVYLGLGKFNARENAANFNSSDFKEAIKIAKSNNVKVFFTANTLIKNSELEEFFSQLKYAYEQGIDAVIIQDQSFISIIRQSFPNLSIHISTQAGIMNSSHANLFDADRINLARELNKQNILSIREHYNKELEIFVHGALCACISGSCLFSSLLGGRSGNRGKCAQPCRKLYNNAYLLSSKELCLIDKLPEILSMKIDSIKIEGRMRTPFYVATVVSNYKKAMDSFYAGKFNITPDMKSQLRNAFSRDFTEGKFSDKFIFNLKQSSGSSSLSKKSYEPLTKNIKVEPRKANSLVFDIKEKASEKKQMIVRVYNEKDALIADKYADIICLDIFNENFKKLKNQLQKPLYAVTPRIMFDSDLEKIKNKIQELLPSGILAGNLGILGFNLKIPIILDYNSNCFNDLSLSYYQSLGTKPILSPELSLKEIEEFKNKDFIYFVHGKIRLMTLVHDLQENRVKDYRGFYFNIKKIFNGAEILNDKELGLFNKIRLPIKQGINQIYIDTESTSSYPLDKILSIYREILKGKSPDVSSMQKDFVLGWSKQGVL